MAPLQSSRLQARVRTVAAGLTEEEAERTLRTQRTLGRMDPARLGARLAELSAQLPPQVVRKLVLTAPAVLHHDLTRSLPRTSAKPTVGRLSSSGARAPCAPEPNLSERRLL